MMIHNHMMRSVVDGGAIPTIDDYSILYTTSDGSLLSPTTNTGNPITKNVYKNGVGKATFTSKCTSIEDYFCNENTKLTSVTLPDCCVALGGRAFRACTALKKINLGKVRSVGTNCFINDSALTDIGDTASLTTIYGGAFSASKITKINLTNVTTFSGDSPFYNCTALTTIVGTIKAALPKWAFRQCTALTGQISIRITAGVSSSDKTYCSSLGDYAFYLCSRIGSIKLVEGGAVETTKSAITLGSSVFSGSYYIYVPSAYYSTYVSKWIAYRSRLKSY